MVGHSGCWDLGLHWIGFKLQYLKIFFCQPAHGVSWEKRINDSISLLSPVCCLHTFSLPGARLSFSLHHISFQKISLYHRILEMARWNLCHSLSSPIGTEKRSRSYVVFNNIQFIPYFRIDLFCRCTADFLFFFLKHFATKKNHFVRDWIFTVSLE